MYKYLAVASIVLALTACASAINQKKSEIYIEGAQNATAAGDWESAYEYWGRALVNARMSDTRDQTLALINYEYGRASGVLCKFSESEESLKLALSLDRNTAGPIYMSLLELGRLNLDQKKYVEAIPYYEELVKILDESGIDKESPMEYSFVLDEYAETLVEAGRKLDGERLVEKAKKLRGDNQNRFSITDRTPYGSRCGVSK